MTDGPATRYARAASDWAPVDWWKLEARALHEVPQLRRALAFFAPREVWKDLSKGAAPAWGCLLTIVNIASFTLPVLAAFVLGAWALGRSSMAAVGTAGLLAAIAAVIGGWGLFDELRNPSGVDPKIARMLGALHLVPSLVGGVIAIAAISQGAAEGAVGVVGLAADVVVGVLHFTLMRGPSDDDSARAKRYFGRLEKALDELPPDERARIYSDLQHALEMLGERGLISGEDLARARELRIGLLGLGMATAAEPPTEDSSGGRSA